MTNKTLYVKLKEDFLMWRSLVKNRGILLCMGFLAATLFSSCDSFQNSQEVKSQIVQQIDYANTNPYKIVIEAKKDSGIITKPASGEANVKPTDTFNLSFSAETDCQFLKWEVYNTATGQDIQDNSYLKIENPMMVDTTCDFVKAPEDSKIQLGIRAVTAKRPQIVLTKPTYQETGSPRTSNIQVLFDKANMDPDSIYYTEQEMKALKKELKLKTSDFLKGDTTNCNDKYYGYKKDGIKHFKNIQISSAKVDGQPLTEYFFDPYWAKEPNEIGGSTLIIQTTNQPAIPNGVTLFVTLDKNFCYFEEEIPVTLRESITWAYKTIDREYIKPEIFLTKDEQDADNYNVILVKDKEGEFKALPFTTDKQNQPKQTLIPEITDRKYLEMRFLFYTRDDGGSGISNKFRLVCENPFLLSDQTAAPPTELPYYSTTETEGFADLTCSPQTAADAQWTEQHAFIIPRTQFTRPNKNYCFSIECIDNDGNATKLSNSAGNVLYFWLNLFNSADIL